MKQKGQAELIIVILLLVIVVTIGILIGSGGLPRPRHTPTPTDWWGTPIVAPSPNVTQSPAVTITEVATETIAPTYTPVVSPTLTTSTQTPIVWTVTLTIPAGATFPPPAYYTPAYRIVRDCAPRFVWQACYWRCCK